MFNDNYQVPFVLAPRHSTSSRVGLTSRVERVDVQAQVHGISGTHALADLLDDAVRPDGVDLARLDDLEAAVPVVLVIRGPAERRADAGVDVGVVLEEALLRRVVEVRPVVDAGYLGGGAAEDLGAPWGGLLARCGFLMRDRNEGF